MEPLAPSVTRHDGRTRLGITFAPTADVAALREHARIADEAGLDLIGMPDHPYSPQYLDTLTVIADLLARTARVGFFTNVANLPLRPPATLAKAAATLAATSGGRFTLGVGAGQAWAQIEAMGGPVRRPPEAIEAFTEAVSVMRAMWAGGSDPQYVAGSHYRLDGVRPGPSPADMEIWVGALFPRMLAATGRLGDGWAAPIAPYLAYERWRPAQDAVDRGALAAGRDPRAVRRIAQLVGTVTQSTGPEWREEGSDPIRTTALGWAEVAERLVEDLRFDDVVFWPERVDSEQVRRFAHDVAPAIRERIGDRVAVAGGAS